ncbi:MAG: YabP/YqfC family sporulation protein [Clostridia bacterium]|nr:YabP/YqfC family sporulation protein [Clostridia bacterium]
MNFISEIVKAVGVDEYSPSPFTFTVVGKNGGYFQNVKKIVDVKRTVIAFRYGSGEIFIYGENLFVSSFSGGDLSVKGKITKIEVK